MKVSEHNKALQLTRRRFAQRTEGFTLIEIIVSFAILALISVSVLSAVMGMAGIQQRDYQLRQDNSTVEDNIAADSDPSVRQDGLNLSLGDYSIRSAADTHSTGIGSYTVLNPGSPAPPPDFILDGDISSTTDIPYRIPLTGYYKLEVWGASGGGNGYVAGQLTGGRGGFATGVIKLEEGDNLFPHAGGAGGMKINGGGEGGANGGGQGGVYTTTPSSSGSIAVTGGGGGASDVRINSDSLTARVIVAGGGGGAGSNSWQNNTTDRGGVAGGAIGGEGLPLQSTHTGRGGTQSNGGATASSSGDMVNGPGIFGKGGSCLVTVRTGGGGGGGWYGGGAGSFSGGAGGSGWIFAEATYNAWTNSTDKPYYLLGSKYWLQNASLIGGNAAIADPRDFYAVKTGMTGNGYVRVSWVGTSLD